MDGTNNEIKFKLLFKAVLKQAAKDAFILRTSKKNKKEAFDFLSGGQDLELSCDIAGVDQEEIKYYMKNISKNNNANYKKILMVIKK